MAKADPYRWSIALGTWWGVPVRAHLLLVLFCVLALAMCFDGMAAEALVFVGVLMLSVALHEAAHSIAAIRMGGEVDQIVLSPFGGLAAPRVPDEPEPQVFVAVAGLITNLAMVVLATASLVAMREPISAQLFNPVAPQGLLEGTLGVVAIKLTLWVNLSLLLVNLLPAYPFDMGPALRAMLWPMLGKRSAAEATGQVARMAAVALLLAAVFLSKNEPNVFPLWAPLVTLAVFLFFSAHQDLLLARGGPAGTRSASDDDSDPMWDNDDADPMVLVEHGAEASRHGGEAGADDEATEDARVDDILARLHVAGYEELSDEERAVLERASRRYRHRRREG
ncbi:Peptidase family M50 [Pirellulimonas nuda]|uniref:Peptidase family M50 n=1 Tax=Pirellulimonas nuda TaxID=2528009 RepID=A0A518DIU7_9BACT|nr:site-2 protease family protein [Pirellulimonas nuda]QDU91376.1 Peptidase family M50 [Pirellulimonas nuda]